MYKVAWMDYIIYLDESEKEGKNFGNFYGGALVKSQDINLINDQLNQVKQSLNLYQEIKFTKITENYIDKYKNFLDAFFNFIQQDKIKIRIMFTQRRYIPVGLSKTQLENAYYLLYYQFCLHAFGFQYSPVVDRPSKLLLFFDELPDKSQKRDDFKKCILLIPRQPIYTENYGFTTLQNEKITLSKENIVEVNSKNHVILQGMDIVLGAMAFKLNNKHKDRQKDGKIGKRTKAKHEIYKHIYGHIQKIYPGFNIGMTTGHRNLKANRWRDPYRHWRFIPKQFEILDESQNE